MNSSSLTSLVHRRPQLLGHLTQMSGWPARDRADVHSVSASCHGPLSSGQVCACYSLAIPKGHPSHLLPLRTVLSSFSNHQQFRPETEVHDTQLMCPPDWEEPQAVASELRAANGLDGWLTLFSSSPTTKRREDLKLSPRENSNTVSPRCLASCLNPLFLFYTNPLSNS